MGDTTQTIDNLIFDLSCLQGQIGNLVLSLNGLEQQRQFDSAYTTVGSTTENQVKQNFIHYLQDIVQQITSPPPEQPPSQETNNTGLRDRKSVV